MVTVSGKEGYTPIFPPFTYSNICMWRTKLGERKGRVTERIIGGIIHDYMRWKALKRANDVNESAGDRYD